jgi:hypothetical protein
MTSSTTLLIDQGITMNLFLSTSLPSNLRALKVSEVQPVKELKPKVSELITGRIKSKIQVPRFPDKWPIIFCIPTVRMPVLVQIF